MTCPNCGWYVRGGARFCPNCGAEMPAKAPRSCPVCRAEIKGEASLCPKCGKVLDDSSPGDAAEEQPAATAPEPAPAPEEPKGGKSGSARSCPSCKTKLKGRVGICPICGEDLAGQRPAAGRRAAGDDWPFGESAVGAERPFASKMRPLSPNWPFDDPEPAPKSKGGSQKAKQTDEGKPPAAAPARDTRPLAAKPAGEAKPAAAGPAPATSQQPEGRNQAPEVRPRAMERPPEVQPWYVSRTTQTQRPGASPRPEPRRAARLAPERSVQDRPPRKGLGLLPWLGLLAGLVLLSVVIYGFVAGGWRLPWLGAGQAEATATPTVQATEVPTQTAQPTPTATLAPPTPTPAPQVHVVEVGESLLTISQKYGIAVGDLIAANNITQADVLRVGQELTIPGAAAPVETPATETTPVAEETPAETPTATAPVAETPTAQPSPGATATVAQEFAAPNLLNPADGATFGAEDILLNWSSVGLLGDDTWYVVRIWTDDASQPAPATGWTRTTAWRIPVSSRPAADAASHKFYWTVTVMRAREGQEPVAISPASVTRTFEWK